jgi:hypothetical protein
VVAARIRDDAAGDFFGCQLQNLVGRSADFEGADGLEAFRLEPDLFAGAVTAEAGKSGFNQRGLHGNVRNAGCCGADGGERDQ